MGVIHKTLSFKGWKPARSRRCWKKEGSRGSRSQGQRWSARKLCSEFRRSSSSVKLLDAVLGSVAFVVSLALSLSSLHRLAFLLFLISPICVLLLRCAFKGEEAALDFKSLETIENFLLFGGRRDWQHCGPFAGVAECLSERERGFLYWLKSTERQLIML